MKFYLWLVVNDKGQPLYSLYDKKVWIFREKELAEKYLKNRKSTGKVRKIVPVSVRTI